MAVTVARVHLAMAHAAMSGLLPTPPEWKMLPLLPTPPLRRRPFAAKAQPRGRRGEVGRVQERSDQVASQALPR
jgi:hypothetical protein